MDHFTAVQYLVACPLNESEVGGDLVLIETSLFSYVNDAFLMLISSNLQKKSSEVSIKVRSLLSSFSFKGHTTVKIMVYYKCVLYPLEVEKLYLVTYLATIFYFGQSHS